MSSSPGQTYSSTFPADLPPSLDDPAAIAQHDQAAYFGLDRLLRHWDRPHRTALGWLVDFGAIPAAVDLAERCQSQLPKEGLDRIPVRWLHMTIRGLGYADETPDDVIEAAVEGVRHRLKDWEPLDLSLVPLAGSPGAVRFSVTPWRQLLDLFDAISDGSQLNDKKGVDVYRPHVGIAYSAVQQPAEPIQQAVRTLADQEPPTAIRINEVCLGRVSRSQGFYQWDSLAAVALGG